MGCVVSLGCYAPNEECSKAGIDRGLFAVLFEVEQGSIYVRAAGQGMENGICWGRLMRMRVAKDHGLRSWVRSMDRVKCGVGCAVSLWAEKESKSLIT